MKSQLGQKALEELIQLFEKWGLTLNDWCLVGEWALILQNYNIKGREGIIDVYVNRKKLPWKIKERQVIPPKNSKYFDDWIKFTQKTKFGLDMIPIPETQDDPRSEASIKKDTVLYQLPRGEKLRVNTPLAEIKIHRWLFKKYGAEDVGQENLDRWWEYIKDIKQAITKKGSRKVIDECEKLLDNYKLPPYTKIPKKIRNK